MDPFGNGFLPTCTPTLPFLEMRQLGIEIVVDPRKGESEMVAKMDARRRATLGPIPD